MGAFPNRIVAIVTAPVNIRPMDVALVVLILTIIHQKFSKTKFSPLIFKNPVVGVFTGIVLIYALLGILRFGYAGIAEFRSVFFYIIILGFVSTCIKSKEFLPIIKSISTYLMPLILLVPLNLVLTGNFSISLANRQFNSFMYETVTVGFLSGFLYYQYIDRSYKLVLYLFPVFVAMVPYCSHRTVWAIIFVTVPFILFWLKNKKYIVFVMVIGALFAIYMQLDLLFLQNRLKAFTDFELDPTGSWRMLIWQAVWDQATVFGKGLGARWVVHARIIGDQAMFGAHNGFIQTLYYLGYLGMGIVILLIGYFLLNSFKNFQARNISIAHRMIHRLSFLSALALLMYMIGYGADVLSWIFIAFSLKLMVYKR